MLKPKAQSPEPQEEPRPVQIRRAVLDGMLAHARAEAPLECCGLLMGTPRVIESAARARNRRASATRYLIDPEDHFAAIRQARAASLEVVGAYHSHPASPPIPSETDTAEAYSDFVYLIVSPGCGGEMPDIRGYLLIDGNFQPVALVPVA